MRIYQPVITPNGVGFYVGRQKIAGRPDRVLVTHCKPGSSQSTTPPIILSYDQRVVIPWPTFNHPPRPFNWAAMTIFDL